MDEADRENAIEAAFIDAADISNAGLPAQVAVIPAHHGLENGERRILEAAGLASEE